MSLVAEPPAFAIAEAGHHEESRCHPLVYNVRGGFFFAKKTAGESPASFGADWIVKSAPRSEVRKGRPYPVSGFPASSVKIVVGMSTTVLDSGTPYLCQLTCCAAAASV
jgi:hypothetical protein